MNPRIDQLVKSLLQKESLEQCSIPELQDFAARNPYFGAAQLLLTKKLQVEQAAGFDQQLQKTLLYFHNPLWVEQWLMDTGEGKLIKSKKELLTESAPEEKPLLAEPEISVEQIPAAEPDTSVSAVFSESTILPPPSVDETPTEFPAPVPEENIQAIAFIETAPVPAAQDSEIATDPVLENPALSASLNQPNDTELLFEPYHTVDYFASQGIKFKEEEKPKDKFGQQLKSFTEWLKTLKKIPASAINPENGPVSEEKVVKLAETSIQDREVYTEAMAEVWEKQGNRSKAIDIYSKLSLLEPDKSTYFAAKIEELKKQI